MTDPNPDRSILALLLAFLTAVVPAQIAADADRDIARIDADARVQVAAIESCGGHLRQDDHR